MSKDLEPPNISDIEQQIETQRSGQTWDYSISAAGMVVAGAMTQINFEPGLLNVVRMLVPSAVIVGGWAMAMKREGVIRYLNGKKDGMIQEVQRTATLTIEHILQ